MNPSRVVVIVAVTAAIVYFGLNVLLPHGKGQKNEPTASATTTTEAVFGGAATDASTPATTDAAAPADSAAPAATEAAATDGTASSEATLTEEEARKIAESVGREVAERVASEAEVATAATETAPAPTDSAPPAEPTPAPAPAPAPAPSDDVTPASTAEPVSTATASEESGGLTEAQARAIAANIARENLANGAVDAAPAPEPVVETAAAPAKPEKKVEKKPEPEAAKPAPSYETVAASSEPPAPRKPKASKPASIATPKAAAKAPGVGSDAVSSWWPKAGTQSADRLSLVYAGEAASEKAIVLMFGSTFSDAAAAGSQIKLVDAKGASPSGTWELGRNPRLLVFKGVTPGRYTVILKPTLADAAGKTLGTELVGPVYVH